MHPLLLKDPKIPFPVNFPWTRQSKQREAHQGQSAAKTLLFLQCRQAATQSRNMSCKDCLMMGGGTEKGLGKTTGYDYSVDKATDRQDP